MNAEVPGRCLNCKTPTTFQNLYCSTTCAEMDRRNRAANKALDERLVVGPVSVLSEADRQTIRLAQVWMRNIYLNLKESRHHGDVVYKLTFDGLERNGVEEIGDKLTDLLVRTSGEPQLFANSNIGGNGVR